MNLRQLTSAPLLAASLVAFTGCRSDLVAPDGGGNRDADPSWPLDAGSIPDSGVARDGAVFRDSGVHPHQDGSTSYGDTTPPTVRVTAPSSGSTFGDELVTVEIEATDDQGLAAVELWIGDHFYAGSASPPYSFQWDTSLFPDGEHRLSARAVDLAGNEARDPGPTVRLGRGGLLETFSNGGGEDLEGWTRGGGWTLQAASDRQQRAGSAALVGVATAETAFTVYERARLVVQLGEAPTLSYWRRFELSSPGFAWLASFKVKVNGVLVEQTFALSRPRSLASYEELPAFDLAQFANQEVTIEFELAASSWTFGQAATARAYIDDITIGGGAGGGTPVRYDGGTPYDSGVVPDSGVHPDAGELPDGGPLDGGVSPDSGPRPDAGPPPASGAPYPNASEAVHQLRRALDLQGPYGVALGGGHLVASNAQGGTGWPRETALASSDQITIPAGATVRHALLWYTGVAFLRPGQYGQGDYTPDRGGPLDTPQDIEGNGVTFTINGTRHGPFDPTARQPPNPSSLGSQSQISPEVLEFDFGTFTGVKQTVWGNRLDITGLLAGVTGQVSVTVDPPEKVDFNGNDASRNGGNPAGNTTHNLCSGGGSWAILVIYEKSDLPRKNLVLMDGNYARAWDYMFFHLGEWQRPKIRIDHAPIQPGARFYTYVPSGAPAGSSLPSNPACTCGCGGQYTLRTTPGGLGQNTYFSNTHVDPPQTRGDPVQRDRSNGPWYLHSTSIPSPIVGNDWTLFQSGQIYTELPNLYEGDQAPTANTRTPVTNENSPDASRDTYAGQPWAGRASVTYHATGNAISVVEVAIDPARITPGETTSFVYLKGDQKDVWKPQHVVSMKWLLFETPLP